jgi:carboxyl-terminal processing protease
VGLRSSAARWGVFGFLAGLASASALGASDPYGGLDAIARVFTDVEAHYQTPLTLEEIARAALAGLAHGLDRHSRYFTPAEWAAIQDRAAGESRGTGAEAAVEECGLRLVHVLRHSPAERAGLKAGDCVDAIDGATLGRPVRPDLLEGPEGTAIRLHVIRTEGSADLALLRGKVRVPPVEVRRVDKHRVVVQVAHFADPVVAAMDAGLASVGGVSPGQGIVLDLRGNPGGAIAEAAALVDRVVDDGTIVVTRMRDSSESTLRASAARGDLGVPLVVLIDRDTASAAEIVAGALRDLGRARLVGERSYGKASIQRIFAYEDGSALKLTVGRYYLPGGETVPDGEGLAPDVVVQDVAEASAAVRSIWAAQGFDLPLATALAELPAK